MGDDLIERGTPAALVLDILELAAKRQQHRQPLQPTSGVIDCQGLRDKGCLERKIAQTSSEPADQGYS